MMKNPNDRIVLAVGVAVLIGATWFALKAPSPLPLPMNLTASTTVDASSAGSPDPVVLPTQVIAPKGTKTIVTITAPTLNSEWVIGEQNTITWNKEPGATGQITLVNAADGTTIGWIQQNIAPTQVYFPWDTRNVFLSKTSALKKVVQPGRYFLRFSFTSPAVLTVTSTPFFLVEPTGTASSSA